jgi:hypothetical protein
MAVDPRNPMGGERDPNAAGGPTGMPPSGNPDKDVIPREPPEDITDRRKALVAAWCGRIKSAKQYYDLPFKRMLADQDFCFGHQWSRNPDDRRYTANLTLRMVAQMTAFLYAKNPKAVARKRERVNNTAWDGLETSLQQMIQTGGMMAMQGGMPGMGGSPGMGMPAGMPPGMPPGGAGGAGPPGMGGMPPGGPPGMPGSPISPSPPGASPLGGLGDGGLGGAASPLAGLMSNPMAMAMGQEALPVMMDALQVKSENMMLDRLGKTLELIYAYQIDNQVHNFKTMMKLVVRRTITCGVAYVKLGYERVMEKRPDMEKGIADISERLATLERLAADHADDIYDPDSKEAEQLRLLLADLIRQQDFVSREGLVFDYPLSTNIIPDPKCISLRNFLGADWVCEQFLLSPNDIEEIYGKDVSSSFVAYNRGDMRGPDPVYMAAQMYGNYYGNYYQGPNWGPPYSYDWMDKTSTKVNERQNNYGMVWEIYCRKDGLVYTVCDGYPDFLREPMSPEVFNEHFYPWYPLIFNECDHQSEIFPPSEVRLMRDQQMEYNRCREGLKEHRIAARPFTAVTAGTIEEDDMRKLSEREPNAIIEIQALQPNQDIKNLLQPFSGPGIDPNLYEVNPVYEDVLRTTGIQEANLGGQSSGDPSATESQIAEGSRMTSMGSNIDDLNDLLTALARNGGQILLQEMDVASVKNIIGQGAVWPQMSRQQVAQEVLLEIEAGSMGRPNAAQEVANAQRIYPLLIQIPGIDPEYLARDLLRRLDDRLDLTQAFKSELPSIVAMNGMAKGMPPMTGPVAGAPQGPQGAANAAKPPLHPPGGPPDMAGQLAGAPPPGAAGAPRATPGAGLAGPH